MEKRFQIVDYETELRGRCADALLEFDDDAQGDARLMKLGESHLRKLALIDTWDGRRIINTAGPQPKGAS